MTSGGRNFLNLRMRVNTWNCSKRLETARTYDNCGVAREINQIISIYYAMACG